MTDDSGPVERPDCSLGHDPAEIEQLMELPIQDELDAFSALANETRYRILLLIHTAEDPVCGCELEPHLDVGQSSISQSLSRLRRAGLVTREKEGRWRYYETTERADCLLETVREGEPPEAPLARG